MSKDKGGKRKPVSKRRKGTASPASTTAAPSTQPPGQRLWEMPYSAVAPRMINPPLGLHNLVARAGHNAGYDIDLTLLDAPDHRLIRSGVLLAHRVLDGRGEWYLGAPDWVPLLPKERIELMSHGDLPEELADLVRPFRRRAPLGPVAALRCERREFALRDDRGTTLALLRDDKVTVRRGGLTTARYREVMLTPVGPGITSEQDGWLSHTLRLAGATPVEKFPRLVTRLGAPSTGMSDFPSPRQLTGSTSFGQFVANLVAARLQELLQADLAVRADRHEAATDLGAAAARLRRELSGLGPALDPDWVADLDEELAWLEEQATPQSSAVATDGPSGLKERLRSERYLTLLELLVTAARAPKAGNSTDDPATDVLGRLLDSGTERFVKVAGRLTPSSPPAAWETAQAALDDLFVACEVADSIPDGRVRRLQGRLRGLTEVLVEANRHMQIAERTKQQVAESSPEQAFELGRRYEHEQQAAAAARAAFFGHWLKAAKKLAA